MRRPNKNTLTPAQRDAKLAAALAATCKMPDMKKEKIRLTGLGKAGEVIDNVALVKRAKARKTTAEHIAAQSRQKAAVRQVRFKARRACAAGKAAIREQLAQTMRTDKAASRAAMLAAVAKK